MDLKTLSFAATPPPRRVPAPERMRAAAGIPDEREVSSPTLPSFSETGGESKEAPVITGEDIIFMKKETYQRVLGELANLKSSTNKLAELNRRLQASEYNEENSFTKLRSSMKGIHDKLLAADKILFKEN